MPVLHYLSNTFLMYFAKVSNHNGLKKKNFVVGFSPPSPKRNVPTPAIVVQSLSCVQLSATPWTAAYTGFPVLHHLPELAQTHVHWVGDAIQPSHSVVPFSFCLQSSPAPPKCPIIQFNSDNIYLEIVSGSTGQGLTPTGYTPCIPLQDSCHLCFQPLAKD